MQPQDNSSASGSGGAGIGIINRYWAKKRMPERMNVIPPNLIRLTVGLKPLHLDSVIYEISLRIHYLSYAIIIAKLPGGAYEPDSKNYR